MNKKDKEHFVLIHDFIKTFTINLKFQEAYEWVGQYFFRYYTENKNNSFNYAKIIKSIDGFMKEMHEANGEYRHDATCYTIALTIQVFLYRLGIRSKLIIGLAKVDEKLFGHAWVEFFSNREGNEKKIFNPGRVKLDTLSIITMMHIDEEVIKSVYK